MGQIQQARRDAGKIRWARSLPFGDSSAKLPPRHPSYPAYRQPECTTGNLAKRGRPEKRETHKKEKLAKNKPPAEERPAKRGTSAKLPLSHPSYLAYKQPEYTTGNLAEGYRHRTRTIDRSNPALLAIHRQNRLPRANHHALLACSFRATRQNSAGATPAKLPPRHPSYLAYKQPECTTGNLAKKRKTRKKRNPQRGADPRQLATH